MLTSIEPSRAVEGGRVVLHGSGFSSGGELSVITIGGTRARVAFGSPRRVVLTVPAGLPGGSTAVRVEGTTGETALLSVGRTWATGLHQVDSPVFDPAGGLYVTYSGPRGQDTPVSIFRVTQQGTREPLVTGIMNATSMIVGPDGALYVSSRFEGVVYRVTSDGSYGPFVGDLGVACGLAFDSEGRLYVGDRSGTVFRVQEGTVTKFASVPASVAAFHLAMGPEDDLYVSAPTLATYDHVYRVDRSGEVSQLPQVFGRPQGLAFGPDGHLYVVDALAGASGLYRMGPDGTRELVVSGGSLIGVTFGPDGHLVVATNETAYRFD